MNRRMVTSMLVALVASVREGINLSAMEFVACQNSFAECERRYETGVLVYSEFAGCASSFEDGAIIVRSSGSPS